MKNTVKNIIINTIIAIVIAGILTFAVIGCINFIHDNAFEAGRELGHLEGMNEGYELASDELYEWFEDELSHLECGERASYVYSVSMDGHETIYFEMVRSEG